MKKIAKTLQSILPLALFFLVWQFLSFVGVLDPKFLPSPIEIIQRFFELLSQGDLIIDILQSIKRVLVGFVLAGIAGISLGVLSGMYKSVYNLLNPIIEMFRPIPPIAWVPLAILWFGLGDIPAFFLVFLGAFFPIFTNTYAGVSSLDEVYKRAALTLGASRKVFITNILIPSALPSIFTGLKIGLGISWMVVIIAEMVGAQSGLGYMIQLNRIILDIPSVMVGMVIIGLIGFAMNRLMIIFEKFLIPWKQ